MIDEFFKSVHSQLYERVTSPLLGTFSTAWIAWNYKSIVVLFSEFTTPEKFRYFELVLYPSPQDVVLKLIVLPFLSAVFFLAIYPKPAQLAFWWWRTQKKKQRDAKQKIENEELLSKDQSQQIRRDMLELENKFDEQLQYKDHEIERRDLMVEKLRVQDEKQRNQISEHAETNRELQASQKKVEDLRDRIKVIEGKLANVNAKKSRPLDKNIAIGSSTTKKEVRNPKAVGLTEEQMRAMKLFSSGSGANIRLYDIQSFLDLNKVRFDVFIESLEKTGLIRKSATEASLTTAGKRFLVENNLV